MNPMGTCEHCGRSYFAEQLTTFDGSILCPECLEMETLICAGCRQDLCANLFAGSG